MLVYTGVSHQSRKVSLTEAKEALKAKRCDVVQFNGKFIAVRPVLPLAIVMDTYWHLDADGKPICPYKWEKDKELKEEVLDALGAEGCYGDPDGTFFGFIPGKLIDVVGGQGFELTIPSRAEVILCYAAGYATRLSSLLSENYIYGGFDLPFSYEWEDELRCVTYTYAAVPVSMAGKTLAKYTDSGIKREDKVSQPA